MKHTRRAVVAMGAVWVLGSTAGAALVALDVPGAVSSGTRGGAFPAESSQSLPSDRPCGTPRPGSAVSESGARCAGYGFSSGSSLALDVVPLAGRAEGVDAANGIAIRTPAPILAGSIRPIASRSTGALTGRRIVRMSPERAWSGAVNPTGRGATRCVGPDCGLISVTDEALFALQPAGMGLTGATPLPAIFLGSWLLNSDDDSFAAHPAAATASSSAAADGSQRPSGSAFARSLRWIAAPEAIIPALLALGIGGLALRSRRGGSR